MGDLTESNSSGSTKLIGATVDGTETDYVAVGTKVDGVTKALHVIGEVDSKTLLDSSLRILQEFGLNNTLSNSSYETIYDSNGPEIISGFALIFNHRKVIVRLQIDGETIFEINCEELKDQLNWNNGPLPRTYVSWDDGSDSFYFYPANAIRGLVDVVISARSTPGQKKKIESYIIQVG